jgi:hypothetical protein
MLILIKLHKEVVSFLKETGNTFTYDDGAHGFDLNGKAYTSTDVEGIYTIQYADIELDGNN